MEIYNMEVYNLITKYLEGSITPSEKEYLHQWLSTSEKNRSTFIAIYKDINAEKVSSYDFEAEKAYEMLIDRINTYEKDKNRRAIKKVIYTTISVAACAILIFISIPFLQKNEKDIDILSYANQLPKEVTDKEAKLILSDKKTVILTEKESSIEYVDKDIKVNKDNPISKKESSQYNQLLMPYGKRTMITFSDGTRAWVNAGTKLVYPVEFKDNKREIYVNGEIFIDVVPDQSRPFIVKTKHHDVTVLGTKFNINAYEADIKVDVVLLSGAVRVTNGENEALLKPNEMYSFSAHAGENLVKSVNAEEYILWINGLYKFDNENLDVILKCLEKYYGVNIIRDKSISGVTFSGKLDMENGINVILKHLTRSLPVEYAIDEDGNYKIQIKK